MTIAEAAGGSDLSVAWWREPTKDQWFAWFAACFGWLLDAFDFTIFLFVMAPIAKEFGVSVTAVASVLTITLWLRLVGAIGSGWLADRIGRKGPLMLSVLWYSVCNFIAGFSPSFTFLFVVRAALGIGMGAEWPAGASLAMESWPARSRGLMGGVLHGAFPLGFALASLAYWLLFDAIGWRGLLWLGVLPAILCVYIRYFVKEPAVWVENRNRQREQNQEIRSPLITIFTPALIGNTLTACWWVSGVLVVYYSVYGLFATWLQTDFKLSASAVATPVLLSNLAGFGSCWFWGGLADWIGRRWSNMIQAAIASIVAPAYLLTNDLNWIIAGVIVQGCFGATLPDMASAYLSERFPTEVRSTAIGFCYHAGLVLGGLVPIVISYLAVERHMGFALPMLIATWAGTASVIAALLISPETKGKVFVSELMSYAQQTPIKANTLVPEVPASILLGVNDAIG
jgi:SHS family lactate transporter-like MFS transporter